MIVQVVPEARLELWAAVEFYESQAPGLGKRFWQETEEHLAWIALRAELPRSRTGGYRRVNLRVFPYFIAYVKRHDVVWILAIAHTHRRPEYWIDRKTS